MKTLINNSFYRKIFQDIFADLLDEEDEDAEIEQVVAKTKHQPKQQKESAEGKWFIN